MPTIAASTTRIGLGWWPRLALWVLVVVFGVLYFGSVKRQGYEPHDTGSSASATVVSQPAVDRVDAMPQAQSQAMEPVAVRSAEKARVPELSAPVQAVESAAFANSLMQVDEDALVSESAPPRTQSSSPESEVVLTGGAPAQVASATVAVPAPDAPANIAVPLVSVPAVVAPVPGAMETTHMPREAEGPSSGQFAATPDEAAVGPGATDAERQRLLHEYEIMRRAAVHGMPQYWGRPTASGQAANPYGYPVHGLGGYPPR